MLAERLKELRNKEGITQGDFAKKLGIARSTYSGYERGTSEPDNVTLDKIANYFEVTTDYLLGRNVEDSTKKHPAEKLREYIDTGMSNEDIKKRMDFVVDVFQLTDEEIDETISFLRWRLDEKKKQAASAASRSREL